MQPATRGPPAIGDTDRTRFGPPRAGRASRAPRSVCFSPGGVVEERRFAVYQSAASSIGWKAPCGTVPASAPCAMRGETRARRGAAPRRAASRDRQPRTVVDGGTAGGRAGAGAAGPLAHARRTVPYGRQRAGARHPRTRRSARLPSLVPLDVLRPARPISAPRRRVTRRPPRNVSGRKRERAPRPASRPTGGRGAG